MPKLRPQPPRRLHATSWEEVRVRVEGAKELGKPVGALVSIVRSVEASPLAPALAGELVVHDCELVVIRSEDVNAYREALVVRTPGSLNRRPPPGCVEVEHDVYPSRGDNLRRPETDAVPLFWKFVEIAFGLT